MTKAQIDDRTPVVQANKKVEAELGLDELFSKWVDQKTNTELLYFGLVEADRMHLDADGKKKIVTETFVSIRYVAGRQKMFSADIWKSKTKLTSGEVIQRFIPAP